MTYAFLVFAILWAAQFGLTYRQMRQFNQRIFALRRRGRCVVGLHGDRWRGRTYAVMVVDPHETIQTIEILSGWTVFARPVPLTALDGQPLTIVEQDLPPAEVTPRQWGAIRHAASFLRPAAIVSSVPTAA